MLGVGRSSSQWRNFLLFVAGLCLLFTPAGKQPLPTPSSAT